jgi:hypothetical protein
MCGYISRSLICILMGTSVLTVLGPLSSVIYESVIGGIKTVSYGPSIGIHKSISLQSSFLNFLHSIMMNLKNLYAIGCMNVAIFISWNFRINI